jgi:hypothetical protein
VVEVGTADTVVPASVVGASQSVHPPKRVKSRVVAGSGEGSSGEQPAAAVSTGTPDSTGVVDSATPEAVVLDTTLLARGGDESWTSGAPPTAGPSATPVLVEPEREPVRAPDAVRERQRLEARILAGVEQCYAALQSKDVDRLTELYHPTTRSDYDNLKKLSRVLRTREWSAEVGPRADGLRQIGLDAAAMDFSVRLTWKDAFGGHLSSQPVFRAEFDRNGDRWDMSSCRIVGSPKL